MARRKNDQADNGEQIEKDQIDAEIELHGSLSDFTDEFRKLLDEFDILGADIEDSKATSIIELAPGFSMAMGYLSNGLAQSALSMNAVHEQRHGTKLSLATTSKCVKEILSINSSCGSDPIESIAEDLEQLTHVLKEYLRHQGMPPS